jgi:hypothetical protein
VTRTLEFSIVVSSSLDCDECNYSTNVTATQVLTMSNGTPDWTRSSFTTP